MDCSRSRSGGGALCVPYFYLLGAFHSGLVDLYTRLERAYPESILVPRKRKDGSYPFYLSETHMWERMLWRGCDYGACPRQRGVGAEPLALSRLPEMAEGRVGARDKVFGEVAGNALTSPGRRRTACCTLRGIATRASAARRTRAPDASQRPARHRENGRRA